MSNDKLPSVRGAIHALIIIMVLATGLIHFGLAVNAFSGSHNGTHTDGANTTHHAPTENETSHRSHDHNETETATPTDTDGHNHSHGGHDHSDTPTPTETDEHHTHNHTATSTPANATQTDHHEGNATSAHEQMHQAGLLNKGFIVAGIGYFLAIPAILFASGRQYTKVYTAISTFTVGQIGIWVYLGMPQLFYIGLLDKFLQISLIAILAALIIDDKTDTDTTDVSTPY